MSDPTPASATAQDQHHRWAPSGRGLAVALLLLVGGLASILASVGVWTQRAIIDEDGFASRVDEVIDRESVQLLLAERLSDVMKRHRD